MNHFKSVSIVSLIVLILINLNASLCIPLENEVVQQNVTLIVAASSNTSFVQSNSTELDHLTDISDSSLFRMLQMLRFLNPDALSKQFRNALKGHASWLTCELCATAISLVRISPSIGTVQTVFTEMCVMLGYEERQVCYGISELFGDEFVYIMENSKLSHSEICGLVISSDCMSKSSEYPRHTKWAIQTLPLSNLHSRALSDYKMPSMEARMNLNSGSESHILHLSDIHLDQYYQVNAAAGCSEPLCCRATSVDSKNSYPAGYWGSYDNCDSSIRTVNSLANTIVQNFTDQYRYMILSGDYIAHDVWNTSKTEIVSTTRILNKIFQQLIPKGKVVVPVVGNHEGHPVDQFCPPNLGIEKFSAKWIYEELLDQWSKWIPTDYHETFRQNGYYSLTDGKARFIVLNMNYCHRLNFWIAYEYIDLGGMLHWFQKELQLALENGQYVYVVGHIAPDTEECATHWVKNYNDIIEIYAKIIKGQFFGHTHFDEIRLYYSSKNNSIPISVAYLAPSVTTYGNVNPSFRLYQTDKTTGQILDHSTYFLNLTRANADYKAFNPSWTPTAEWEFEYSAKEAYNLTSLSASAWDEFVRSVKCDDERIRKYYKYYGRYDNKQVDNKSNDTILEIIKEKVFVKF